MKISIFTVTSGGIKLAKTLKKFIPEAKIYGLKKFLKEDDDIRPIEPDLKTVVRDNFSNLDYMVFIMATGIVVRTIAPYIKDKYQDPGIIVMDEMGQNVISLLSGHIGGANELTIKIAQWLDTNPVITTASDIQRTMAVDTLAEKINGKIIDWILTKKITAHIVNGQKVGIYWDDVESIKLPSSYEIVNNIKELLDYDYGIFISNRELERDELGEGEKNILQIYPKNLILGIGCRRDTPEDIILESIKKSLAKVNKSINSVKKISTVDIKADELGIIQVAEKSNIPLEIISRDEIKKIEEMFETSPFVKKTIGVGSVSEPCAYIGSNGGEFLLKKEKNQGTTISIAIEKREDYR